VEEKVEGRGTVRLVRDSVLAALAVAAAGALTATFLGFFQTNIFLLFLVAVLGANLLGGWIPGAVASATAVYVLGRWIFEPLGRFELRVDDLTRLTAFAVATVVIGALSHALLEARARARSRERSLRESEESYRGLFDNTAEAIFLVDRGGALIESNKAAARLYGFTREELVGRSLALLTAPAQRNLDDETDRVERAFAGELQRYGSEGVTRDSVPFPVEIALSRTRYFGRDAVLVVARDLSERHRLEEQLRHAQRMEAVGRLAGGVAHDFNNVLTSIGGHAALALEGVGADSAVREELEEIQRGTEFAESLTRQLLAFSRQQVTRPDTIDLGAVVTGLDRMLRRLIPEDVALETDLDPDAGSVRMDRGQLEQVLMNLVVNARDALPHGGRVCVRSRRIHGNGSPGNGSPGTAALIVADDGVGMDHATRTRIFEPFFTTKPVGKGTGLGLSTVYGIVSQAGGTIEVRSAPGSGTEIEVRLPTVVPLPPVAEAGAAADWDPAPVAATGTILLIEDEDAVRALVLKVLTNHGYKVITAANGREGVEEWERHGESVDLVLTDVVMPDMGGPEAVQRMREDRPELPVLFTSGYTEHEGISRGLAAGRVRLLQKPFTPAALLREVARTLQSARANAAP